MIFRRRFWSVIAIPCLLSLILIGKVFFLQVIQYHRYTVLSNKNLIAIVPVAPLRGKITDRNGVILADNTLSYQLMVTPDRIKDMDASIHSLMQIIHVDEKDIQAFKKRRKHSRPYQKVLLKPNLSEKDIAIFYVNQYRLPGFSIGQQSKRYYPQGAITAPAIGYIGRINDKEIQSLDPVNYSATNVIGKLGIEKLYESKLHGQVGYEELETNADGHIVRKISSKPAKPGENLKLSIDTRLQKIAYRALGHESGAIVGIDPQTGEVLIFVSKPSVDPNLFIRGMNQKTYSKLLNSPSHPLFNRITHGRYAPGSVIKPFYGVGSLDERIITPQTSIFDKGWFQLPGTKHIYHDWKYGGHGWVNIKKAIMVSCDTFFYSLAANSNITDLDAMLYPFGFGSKTGIDLPNEYSGIIPTPDWKLKHTGEKWYKGDTIISAIGQGFVSVTPLQLAYATAILATHGTGYKPHLVIQVDDNPPATPIVDRQIHLKNANNWNIIIKAMQSVIKNPKGTGVHFGRDAPYPVAAKTGTAQLYGKKRDELYSGDNIDKRLRNNHLFISFAPINHPHLALAVIVEHSAQAAQISRQIYDTYFQLYQGNHGKAHTQS